MNCVNTTFLIPITRFQTAIDRRSVISIDLIHVSDLVISQNDIRNYEVKLLTRIPKLISIIPFKFICFYAKSDSIFRVENKL